MVPSRPFSILLAALVVISRHTATAQEKPPPKPVVRISATVSTRTLIGAIGRAIKDADGPTIIVSSNVTSSDCLGDLAEGRADIAFITKPISGQDRAVYPEVDFVGLPVGMQVAAIGVSDDLWEAGIHAITADSMRDVYEQKITNWKTLAGPDKKIDLFSFEQGRGIWEIFAEWLYGDVHKAPIPKVTQSSNSEDALSALEFGSGTIAPLGAGLVDGARCHALSIEISGTVVSPTVDSVASGAYPLARPLLAVCVGRPTNANRFVTEFLTGPTGQSLLKTDGDLGLDAVPKPKQTSDY